MRCGRLVKARLILAPRGLLAALEQAMADLSNLGMVLSTRFFKSEVGSGHIVNEAVQAPACLP